MITVKGIISFPTLFTPKVAQGATEAKFNISILLPPNDPQIAVINQLVEQAKLDAFPSGYTGTDQCLNAYDVKFQGKSYYDARFSGWWVFSCSAKADDRPSVVDTNYQPVLNPSDVYSGMIAHVNAGVSGYVKGRGGIGGWLNGVMITSEDSDFGRLDGKPSTEQMFAGIGNPGPANTLPPQVAAPPAPMAPPAPPAPVAPVAAQRQMTAAANGTTYEAYVAAGWSDDLLIQNGMMVGPTATPSFT
jgi:hypothetical protein